MTAKSSKLAILVPVDFSAHSASALLKACELAECAKQQIIVLHVVHDPGEMPGYYAKGMKKKKLLVRIEDAAKDMLEEFIADLQKKNPDVPMLKKNRDHARCGNTGYPDSAGDREEIALDGGDGQSGENGVEPPVDGIQGGASGTDVSGADNNSKSLDQLGERHAE